MDADLRAPRDVEAPLTFLINTGHRPVNYASVAGVSQERRGGSYEQHAVTVRDARPLIERISLDAEGYKLVRHVSQVDDFFDEDEVQRTYEPEVVALVKQQTGASEVVIFDHTWRADSERIREEKTIREPAQSLHNDYTDRSAPQRVRDILGDEAEARLGGRYAFYNVWRPVTRPVQTAPLCLCDARSVAADDLVPTERRAPGRVGEIYQLAYNPEQRWFYFPQMQLDEALLLKVFDSATDGRARFAPHGAFTDPTAAADAPPRESIETRTMAFFS